MWICIIFLNLGVFQITIINFFNKRPLVIGCSVFLLILMILSKADTISRIIAFFFGIILSVLSIAVYKKLKFELFLILFIPVVIASAIGIYYFDVYYKGALKLTETPVQIQAVALENTLYTNYSSNYNIIIEKINNKKVNYKAKLKIEYPCDIKYNERFIMNVTLHELDDVYNGFPVKDYNISKGYIMNAVNTDKNIVIYENNDFSLRTFFNYCNEFCSNILNVNLDKKTFDFTNALLLGNQKDMSISLKRDMRYLGLSHMVSVSGMHFSILMGALSSLLRFLKIHKRVINIILIVTALFFMGLTGFSPSVTRSALMFVIYILSFYLRRVNDSPTSLFLSVSLICFFNPNAILDVGLLMSFSATLGILTLGLTLNNYIKTKLRGRNIFIRFIKSIIFGLSATISAVLFTLPLTWLNFGMISIISPITNIICSVPVTLILALSPLIIIFAKFPPLLYLLNFVVTLSSNIFYYIINYFLQFYNAAISLKYDFVKYVILFLILGLIVITFIKKFNKNPLIFFVPIILSVFMFSVFLHYHNQIESEIVRIMYITDKKNEAFIVKHGTRAMICDISDGSYGVTNVAEYLLTDIYCMLEIDTFMLTHYHQRHISTISRISQNTFITNLILPEPITETDFNVMNSLVDLAETNGIKLTIYPKNDEAYIKLFDKFYIEIMKYTKLSRSTHPVLSFNINTDNQKLSYFGSSVFESANFDYLDKSISDADIIIFGQHGPILKKSIDINAKTNYLQFVIYANDEFKQAVTGLDSEYKIHNQEKYYSEVAFYVH